MRLHSLPVNHLGVIVEPSTLAEMAAGNPKNLFVDDVQGVSVFFKFDSEFKTNFEYIAKEGRAARFELGFNHVCLDVDSENEFQKIHDEIVSNSFGFRLTFPEVSAATGFCNRVAFYQLKTGIVEFNILE